MRSQLNYFVLNFKVDGVIHVEGIEAATFSMAKDKLRLYFPDCYDINFVEQRGAAAPMMAAAVA
ncbi:MAG: hypothetical protein WBA12_16130 [Catalinimonas sp.]